MFDEAHPEGFDLKQAQRNELKRMEDEKRERELKDAPQMEEANGQYTP